MANGLCEAPGCPRRVRLGVLACREHWFELPARLRSLINAAWAARQDESLLTGLAIEDHEHWKAEARTFWQTGTWTQPGRQPA
jgi:hypothetical protein